MNNYEYIIACLPVIQQGEKALQSLNTEEIIDEIRSQCSQADNALLDIFLTPDENLNEEFYRGATSCKNRFIREYFKYDLGVRNTKVEYLNKELGRAAGTDTVILDEENEFEEAATVKAVLENNDILSRERGLDDLMWDKVEDLMTLHNFDIDVILGFLGKLKIVDRWLKLDPETGRKRFRELVEEIKKTE